jgi:hypothetical protein
MSITDQASRPMNRTYPAPPRQPPPRDVQRSRHYSMRLTAVPKFSAHDIIPFWYYCGAAVLVILPSKVACSSTPNGHGFRITGSSLELYPRMAALTLVYLRMKRSRASRAVHWLFLDPSNPRLTESMPGPRGHGPCLHVASPRPNHHASP